MSKIIQFPKDKIKNPLLQRLRNIQYFKKFKYLAYFSFLTVLWAGILYIVFRLYSTYVG